MTSSSERRYWADFEQKDYPFHVTNICVTAQSEAEARKILKARYGASKVYALTEKCSADEWYLDRWYTIDPVSYRHEWKPDIKTSQMINILIRKYPVMANQIIGVRRRV